MRYAIDRYTIGKEKEVNADDFDGHLYIPARRSRFYCPECSEIVYFRAKGGTKPNQFYHQEKTESAPECDRRVDGRSGLSLNERVGLPLYLAEIISGEYQLRIGFPALGKELLTKASSANYSVEVSFGSTSKTIKLDFINFTEDTISLFPLDFVPTNGRNYSITINGDKSIFGLRSKWSDHADGFGIGGAIFIDDGNGGKKIHRGDSITTHRNYYAVVKSKFPKYLDFKQELVGRLKVGTETYKVYRIQINVSLDDEYMFNSINNYLKSYFGVWLLECQPELIPIWPPVIQTDCLNPITNNTKTICAISSANNNPSVYVYSEYGVSEMSITKTVNGIKMVELSVGKSPITLSVDRKYVGREVTFRSVSVPKSSYSYDVSVRNLDGTILQNEVLNQKSFPSNLLVQTNGKMELYAGTKDKIYQHVPLRQKESLITTNSETSEIYLVIESAIIYHLQTHESITITKSVGDLTHRLEQNKVGEMVPIPRWAWSYISNLKRNRQLELYKLLIATISDGRIYVGILKVLREEILKSRSNL